MFNSDDYKLLNPRIIDEIWTHAIILLVIFTYIFLIFTQCTIPLACYQGRPRSNGLIGCSCFTTALEVAVGWRPKLQDIYAWMPSFKRFLSVLMAHPLKMSSRQSLIFVISMLGVIAFFQMQVSRLEKRNIILGKLLLCCVTQQLDSHTVWPLLLLW